MKKNLEKDSGVIQNERLSFLTYADLKRSHQDKLLATNKNRQQIRNQISSLSNFMKYLGQDDNDLADGDFGINFQNNLNDYICYCKSKGLVQSTITNNVSHLKKIEKTAKDIMIEDGLPICFKDALKVLVERSGGSQKAISEFTGIKVPTLNCWILGIQAPGEKSKKFIPKLESFFDISPGVLQKRFPKYPHGLIKELKIDQTEYGKKQQKLIKERYRYNNPGNKIRDEWLKLLYFFTTPFFLDCKERNSKWRVKPKNSVSSRRHKWYTQAQEGVCPVAAIKWEEVASFLGFLILPQDKGGEGLAEKSLSLALLSDANLIFKYINFRKNRSSYFTNETLVFLRF